MCRPFMQPSLLLLARSHPRPKALKLRLLSCNPFFQVDTYAATFLDLWRCVRCPLPMRLHWHVQRHKCYG